MIKNQIKIFFVGILLLCPSLYAKGKKPDRVKKEPDFSITEGKREPIPARAVRLPAFVQTFRQKKTSLFVPSGYMGDIKSFKRVGGVLVDKIKTPRGVERRKALRFVYKPKGPLGWSGLYWLTPANNWGKIKAAGYDLSKAERLVFWMRGKEGGEKITTVKVGGVKGAYPDTDVATLGPLRLTKEWQRFTIDLKNKDLRHIIGGFQIFLRRGDNPTGATFFLGDVVFLGENQDLIREPGFVVAKAPPKKEKKIPVQRKVKARSRPKPAVPLDAPVRRVILFTTGNKDFTPRSKETLVEVVGLAKKHGNSLIKLEGHTDNVGAASINLKLSKQRAGVVAKFLSDQGLEQDRMVTVGYGEDRPVASNETKEGRFKNRRVEIVLTPRS